MKAGRHLLALIDEVLDISRIEAGRLPLSPEPVLVGELLREALDLVRPLADQRDIELRGAPTDVWDRYVQADRQRLKQVVLNLASNAVKFSTQGQRVLVCCQQVSEDRLRILVTDTGPGIPAEMMGRLFTACDRLDANASSVEGTGLGLALSKRLVDVMGGAIGVESVAGRGSTFWVELPQTAPPPEVFAPSAAGELLAAAEDQPAGTVLYIEDNLANVRLLQRVVARRPSVQLLTAMQGRVGLELARRHCPALILLDLHLPDISGQEVLQQLRQDPETDGIPVIVISADATPGQIERLLGAGAQEFLTKPFDVRKLLSLIDDVLQVRH